MSIKYIRPNDLSCVIYCKKCGQQLRPDIRSVDGLVYAFGQYGREPFPRFDPETGEEFRAVHWQCPAYEGITASGVRKFWRLWSEQDVTRHNGHDHDIQIMRLPKTTAGDLRRASGAADSLGYQRQEIAKIAAK